MLVNTQTVLSISLSAPVSNSSGISKTTTSEDSQLLNKNPNFRYSDFNWDINSVGGNALAEVALPSQVFAGINPITGIYCLIQNVVPNTSEKTNYMINEK